MNKEIIHVIDFEGNKRLGISEFGITTLQDFEIISCQTETCNGNFFHKLETFLSLRRNGIFCAHSAQIEDSLLRHYWASPGRVPVFSDNSHTVSWGPWIDTKVIYRKLFKKLRSYELNDLISYFHIDDQLSSLAHRYCTPGKMKFHNALFDSLAATLLVQNLHNFFTNVSLSVLLLLCNE